MPNIKQLIHRIESGAANGELAALYAPDGVPEDIEKARRRTLSAAYALDDTVSPDEAMQAVLVSGPGRTEIGGNHTDHQHGHVLCASVDMDILACAALNETCTVRIRSEGYPPCEIGLDRLEPIPAEKGTSAALVRGIAARIAVLGFDLCGMDICMTSAVPSGSGLSSSAAFETLIANAFNHFCCGGALTPVEIAKIGQYAENVYFGKPCGLMDQMACSLGGAVAIDFTDPSSPKAERINTDGELLPGYTLCIIDTRSGHEDLTAEYAAIPAEMGEVAAFFGKKYLRDVSEGVFMLRIPELRRLCGDRAVLRAMHFFEDDKRAVAEADALRGGDIDKFLRLVNESGISSALKLQNIWAHDCPQTQPVSVALETGRRLLGGEGAIRVHGGGFAGTIQAFVPRRSLDYFIEEMEALLGKGCCHMLRIRPYGGYVLD